MGSWTPVLRVVVPGEAQSKQRPRFSKKMGRSYTPAPTVAYQKKVAGLASVAMDTFHPDREGLLIEGRTPVWVQIMVVLQRPQALMRVKDPEGMLYHTKRPDVDNIGKAVLDGLDEVEGLWVDDSQVCDLSIRKRYAQKGGLPYVEVSILELKDASLAV